MAKLKLHKNNSRPRVALYIRRSDSKQKNSIARQNQDTREFCADDGLNLVGNYTDDGVTGVASADVGLASSRKTSRKKRNDWLQLVEDGKAGKFDYVLCWEQFRASRSVARHVIQELNPLADVGIKFIFMDLSREPMDLDDFAHLLQVMIKAQQGSQEPITLGRRVISGQRAKALRGLHVSGPMILGMKSVAVLDENGQPEMTQARVPMNGKIEPGDDPYDIETVNLIFQWYDEGLTLRPLVKRVRDERGLVRSADQLSRILRHPYYVGDYVWNRSSRARFYGVRDGRVCEIDANEKEGNTSKEDWVFIGNNHTGIVDRELFNRVQLKLMDNRGKTTPFSGGGKQLLTGLCWCAKCGNRFQGWSSRQDTVKLQCDGYRKHDCTANYVNQIEVVAAVLASIEDLLTEENIATLREKFASRTKQRKTAQPTEWIQAKIAKLEKKYSQRKMHLQEMQENGDYPQRLLNDMATDAGALAVEIEELEKQLERTSLTVADEVKSLDDQIEKLNLSIEGIRRMIADAGAIAAEQPHVLRTAMSAIVERIDIEVADRGKGRSPRFSVEYGPKSKSKLSLNPSFNLLQVA